MTGDELAFAVDFDGTELLAWGGVETPCILAGAGEPVAPCEAAAVFVEPEFAIEFEAWGALGSHAAHFFLDGEGGLGFPEVEGETAPAFGHGGLGDVDGGDVAEFDDAEGGVGLEGDEFLGCERGAAGGVGEGVCGGGAEGVDGDLPFAWAELSAEFAVVVEGAGER